MNYKKYSKNFTKKVFLSNELKRALFVAFHEAQKQKMYVTPELLMYGLIEQPTSLAARITSLTISQFCNDKKLTSNVLADRLYKKNQSKLKKLDSHNQTDGFSEEIWNENSITPWLTSEIKELWRASVNNALKNNQAIFIINTKNVLFELLNKEYGRKLLQQLIND